MNNNAATNETTGHQGASIPYFMSHRAPIYFLFFSILCQLIGLGLLSILKDYFFHPVVLLTIHSLLAFALARWLRLSLPWQLFNLLLAPGIVIYTTLELPSGLAFLALVYTILLYAPTFWTRVPYYPTAKKMYRTILDQTPENRSFTFIDLGCGLGSLLAFLSTERPAGQFEGVEISPLAYIITKLRFAFSPQKNVHIRLKNFWGLPLGTYDVVYAFLAPGPMPALWEKAKQEMKAGSVFITNTFPVESNAAQVIEIDDSHQGKLYVHQF